MVTRRLVIFEKSKSNRVVKVVDCRCGEHEGFFKRSLVNYSLC